MEQNYFGIIGDHEELVSYALKYLHAKNIVFIKKNIITFSTSLPDRLANCASLIKRGITTLKKDLAKKNISDTVGVADKILGTTLKKKHDAIKRFKIVELIHTDREIKESGTEIIEIDPNTYGIVSGYQNISLYETIDFHKPIGGMGIGMMPSKLALTLINIGIGTYETAHQEDTIPRKQTRSSSSNRHDSSVMIDTIYTIRDPFCGFGTTNFLANHLGYNTIGSDINPIQAKQNRKRRTTVNMLSNGSTLGTFLKHDVTQAFKNPIFRNGNIIVSEGRLGHIVTNKTALNEVEQFSKEVAAVYKSFFINLTELQHINTNQQTLTVVITIPTRLKHNISISASMRDYANSLGRTTTLLDKPYSRDKQLVGRQVLIANFQ